MIKNWQVSPHFSFFDLTRTDHADLQEENRNVSNEEERKLGEVANLLEECRVILGCDLETHSVRRYPALNKRVGGSEKSQHLRCEAADFSPVGLDSAESIAICRIKLSQAGKQGKLKFGQLISESDGRGREGRKFWLHISLGTPYRDEKRCMEVWDMVDGKFIRLLT